MWWNSLGSAARLRTMFFREHNMTLSSTASMLNDPSGSTIAWRSSDWTISAAWLVPNAKLVYGVLTYLTLTWILLVWICKSCKSFWMVFSACCCFCLNCCSNSTVVSCTLSTISSRSPYVKSIGSSDDFVILTSFTTLPYVDPCISLFGRECSVPPHSHHPSLTTPPPQFGAKDTYHYAQSRTLLVWLATSQCTPFPPDPSPQPIFCASWPTTRPSAWLFSSFYFRGFAGAHG